MIGSGLAFAGTLHSKIEAREHNQNKRKAQGVENGQLTNKEAGFLQAEQSKIKNDIKDMKSGGILTENEYAKNKKEQHRASDDIHRLKHNKKNLQLNHVDRD